MYGYAQQAPLYDYIKESYRSNKKARLSMSKILIAGCGYVGKELASRLVGKGLEVLCLSRSKVSSPGTNCPIDYLRADLSDPTALLQLPGELDGIVFCAAPDTYDEAAYRKVYVDGLANLQAAISGKTTPEARMIYVSSTGVFGQADGEWVNEESDTYPDHFGGKILLEGESLAFSSGLQTSILRLGGIYGPGRDSLIKQIKRGELSSNRVEQSYTNRIHRDDAVGILEFLLLLPAEKLQKIYLGVDSEPASRNDVVDWLSVQLGVSPCFQKNTTPIRGGGNKRCSNERIRSEGYQFQFQSYREGYAALIRS